MEIPLQIAFRNLEYSEAVAARVRERTSWLQRYYPRLVSCRVTVEEPHRHHRRGNLYRVKVEMGVPGGSLVVGRRLDLHEAHKDIYVAVHDAFDEARRELEDYSRLQRGEVKRSEAAPHGFVVRLLANEGGEFGFLSTEDGREIYFHRNSVLNGKFDQLKVGTEVRFAEEMGDEGPQASTVEIVGKQGRHLPKAFGSAPGI